MMKHPILFTLLIIMPASLTLSGTALGSQHTEHDRMMREHASPAAEPQLKSLQDLAQEIRALRSRVATLEALKPQFTNFMPNFAERFHVAHRAGEVGDWAVAAHEVDEMRRLTGISQYIDPELGKLMQGFMDGNLRELREAIEHASGNSFQAAMKDTVAGCNACHAATGSTLPVTLDVDDTLSLRHPHGLRRSRVPRDHTH